MDEETSNVHGMGGGIGGVNGVGGSGHTNGVYSLVWGDGGCAMGLDTFISGGWDKNVFFWDTRAGTAKPVRAIYGPFLGGDALDIDDYLVRIYISIYNISSSSRSTHGSSSRGTHSSSSMVIHNF